MHMAQKVADALLPRRSQQYKRMQPPQLKGYCAQAGSCLRRSLARCVPRA